MPTRRRLTHLAVRNLHPTPPPGEFDGIDIRLPAELAEHLIERYSEPGAVVLDPFAGFGTVPTIAEYLGRVGYGIELDEKRAAYARSQLRTPERLLTADARKVASLGLPTVDFVLSSPPYMHRADNRDPLSDFVDPGSYETYLADVASVFQAAAGLLKPTGHLVIEVANLKRDGHVTTLAWDLGSRLASLLQFEGETVVAWDRYGFGYDHSYCLAFRP